MLTRNSYPAMELGFRVVRGPDWRYGNQDGGEGHVGTVTNPKFMENHEIPEGTVFVVWDNGTVGNYSSRKSGPHDLLVFDSAPAGVTHISVTCDICWQKAVAGINWQCTQCENFYLCNECYMNDKHDLNHIFKREDTAVSPGVVVSPRSKSKKRTAKGLFVGAKVVRGPDWSYAEYDGGDGSFGKVVAIGNHDKERQRCIVEIAWDKGGRLLCRAGLCGSVDVQCITPADGKTYYEDHLPNLGSYVWKSPTGLMPGDKVTISVDVKTLEKLQQELGPELWNPDMAECIGRSGIVMGLIDGTKVSIFYQIGIRGKRQLLIIHPKALVKLKPLERGDSVQVLKNLNDVMMLQNGHGGWNPAMKTILGKTVKVADILPNDDVIIIKDGNRFVLNRDCCRFVSKNKGDDDDLDQVDLLPGGMITPFPFLPGQLNPFLPGQLNPLLPGQLTLLPGQLNPFQPGQLNPFQPGQLNPFLPIVPMGQVLPGVQPPDIQAVLEQNAILSMLQSGNVVAVRSFFHQHPGKVNQRCLNDEFAPIHIVAQNGPLPMLEALLDAGADKNLESGSSCLPLHYAAAGGQKNIVSMLLRAGSSPTATDNQGLCSIHFAAHKGHAEVLSELLKTGIDVNFPTHQRVTALHLAANKGSLDCVKILLQQENCNPNLQNNMGSSVLSEVITAQMNDLFDLISNSPKVDLSIKNKDGITYLHTAVVSGNKHAVKFLMQRAPDLVNVANNSNMSALHFAAITGQREIMKMLLDEGNADLDVLDSEHQTPLILAVGEAHASIVELLILKGAKVDIENKYGLTCLHSSLMDHSSLDYTQQAGMAFMKKSPILSEAPRIAEISLKLPSELADRTWVAMSCFLISHGAQLELQNSRGITPISLVKDPLVIDLLRAHATDVSECMMCSDMPVSVTFLPCGHRVACGECSRRMKKCILCHLVISSKV